MVDDPSGFHTNKPDMTTNWIAEAVHKAFPSRCSFQYGFVASMIK